MTSPANDRRKGSDTAPLLTVDNLTVTFQRQGPGALPGRGRGEFRSRPGQTVGLVGESGCGKSVTSLAIMGLLPERGNQVTGTVDYEGTNLLTHCPTTTCGTGAAATSRWSSRTRCPRSTRSSRSVSR